MDCKYYTIRRWAGISSTATGYEFHMQKRGMGARYTVRPIHASSMRRFYRLSKNDMSVRIDKYVDWQTYRNL